MTSERWYPTVTTLADGSQIIVGGTTSNLDFDQVAAGNFNNNPTYEYWPSKQTGVWPKTLQLLEWAYPHNLYSPTFQLPTGKVMIFSSNRTVLIDPTTDVVDDQSIQPILLKNKQPWVYPHTPGVNIINNA